MASVNVHCPNGAIVLSSDIKTFTNYKYSKALRNVNLPWANKKFEGIKERKSTARAAISTGEGDLASYSNGNGIAVDSAFIRDEPVGIEVQADALAFGSLSADTIPTASGFPNESDEFDLDRPTEGFASIPEAIEDVRKGKMVIVVDDEDRENEGDLIMAASKATPKRWLL